MHVKPVPIVQGINEPRQYENFVEDIMRPSKHLIRLSLGIIALTLSCRPGIAAEKFVFAHLLDVNSASHKEALWAADEVKKRTQGRYEIEVMGGGTLVNSDVKIIEALKIGTADLAIDGAGYNSKDYAPLVIAAGPLNFRDFAHWKAFRDSDIFKETAAGYEKASGNTVLGLIYYGQRHMSTKSPITSMANFQGLKIRVPTNQISLDLFKTLGATPVAVPFAEVYEALKQGSVDAQENPLPTILGMKFYEITPVITLTGHLTDSQLILARGEKWDKLPPQDKAIFVSVFREAAARTSDDISQEEKNAVDKLKAAGATVNNFDQKLLAAALKPLLDSDAPWAGAFYQRVQALH
jgi:tripartite ATP-independent transporter DctP family solute receptor